jgi:hypothetical protein
MWASSRSLTPSLSASSSVHTNFVGVDPVVGALTITISKEKVVIRTHPLLTFS